MTDSAAASHPIDLLDVTFTDSPPTFDPCWIGLPPSVKVSSGRLREVVVLAILGIAG
jgi:hypothetical protein